MNTSSNVGNGTILTSDWTGLNPLLIARLYPVDSKGMRAGQERIEVQAPIVGDANIEATMNWQSPFEGSSPDTKAPALTAMLQSGALLNVFNDVRSAWGGGKTSGSVNQPASGAVEKELQSLVGRTGITQLNSTLVFTGMPPIKINIVLFRAFSDAQAEVDAPLQQLWSWALPQMLNKDSIVKRVANSGGSVADFVTALLPSQAPQLIGFTYKRQTYAPMVIESIREPISAPITKDGYYSEITIPLTLCTLSALDKDDMRRIRRG